MFKKRSIRSVALIITVLMLITLFAGCKKSDDTETTTTTTRTTTTSGTTTTTAATTTTEPVDPFAEHLEITWVGWLLDQIYPYGTESQKIIEERFNVTIENIPVDIYNADQFNLLLAGGTIPDRFASVRGVWQTYADEGIIRPINPDWVWEIMPVWMENCLKYIPEDDMMLEWNYKDNYYLIPIVEEWMGQGYGAYIRVDWLENVGINKVPETLDETYAALRAFRYDDPDQNGQDDTYGMSLWDEILNRPFHYFFGAHGIQIDSWYVDDSGKVYATNVSTGFRDTLKFIRRLIEEDIIDINTWGQTRDDAVALLEQNKTGYFMEWGSNFEVEGVGSYGNSMLKASPQAKVAYVPAPTGPDGKSGMLSWRPSLSGSHWRAFGKNASDEVVKRIMAIEEAFMTDEDFYMRISRGVEGLDWEWDANGVYKAIPNESDTALRRAGAGWYCLPQTIPERSAKLTAPSYAEFVLMCAQNLSRGRTIQGVAFAHDPLEEVAQDIASVTAAFWPKALRGEINIDLEWDAYVQQWMDAGGKALTEAYQKAYDSKNK